MDDEPRGSEPIIEKMGISMRWWTRVTFLLLVIVELCWVVPWYRTIIQVTYVASPIRASLVLGSVMLFAYLVTQALESLRIIRGLQYGILVFGLVISLFVSLRALLISPALSSVNGLVKLDPGTVLVVF